MKRKTIFTILLVVFAAVFLFSAYNIITTLIDYEEGKTAYSQLQQYVDLTATQPAATQPKGAPADPTDPSTPETPTTPTQPQIASPSVDFEALQAINPDVVAWIYVEGTEINYPVVQGTDNQYYVDHMFSGKYNRAGSIFLDRRNQPDFTDPHTILYGHNMKNGTMFAAITQYRDQAFYDAHPTGLIITPEGTIRFHVVAGYVAKLSDPAWELSFASSAERYEWALSAMNKSGFASTYPLSDTDRFLTLSTCSYEFNDARFVLLGVLE